MLGTFSIFYSSFSLRGKTNWFKMLRGFIYGQTGKTVNRLRAQNFDTDLKNNLDNLPEDLLHIIFDHLSLADLFRVSQQSPRLKNVTEKYFKISYKGRMVHMKQIRNENQIVYSDPLMELFKKNIQSVTIHGNNIEILHEIGQQGLSPTHVVFKDFISQNENATNSKDPVQLRNLMTEAQQVEFIGKRFSAKFHDSILRHAVNMRSLKIELYTLSKGSPQAGYKSHWCFWNYPKLSSIHWDNGIENPKNFLRLLKINPQINNMKFSHDIPKALDFLAKNRIQLNTLSLELHANKNIKSIVRILEDLFRKNVYVNLDIFFGKTHILFNHIRDISSLEALSSIEFPGAYHPSIGLLQNLKKLKVKSVNHAIDGLPLLEKLYIEEASIESIRPLIRSCKKLSIITIKWVQRELLPDIDVLIDERARLFGACPMNLFLEEWAYINLKKYAATAHSIDVRRIESRYSQDI